MYIEEVYYIIQPVIEEVSIIHFKNLRLNDEFRFIPKSLFSQVD
jgi:hypothetical protein